MGILSKPLCINAECWDVGHPFQKYCSQAVLETFIGSFKTSYKVYAIFYLLSAILRGRPLKYYLTKFPIETGRSSLFLAANCFYFLGFFCLARKFFGNINYWGTLLFNIPACFLSILIERKQRRGLLALYLTNLATETAFNMMVYRKWISKIKNGEVLLFSLATAIYAFLFKLKLLDGSIFNLIKNFVGDSEITAKADHENKLNRKSNIVKYYGFVTNILNNSINLLMRLTYSGGRHDRNHNYFIANLRKIERKIENHLNVINRSNLCRHHLCNHRYNCFSYAIFGFIQRFLVGYFLQAAVKLLGSLGAIFKNPKFILKILKNPMNKELGLFLGFYVFIFRAISCIARWITNKNSKIHALIAGFFSGFSMIFYKSSSIALYLNFKLLEVLWMLGVKYNKLPLFRSFDSILYALSTAFVLWSSLFEPHNLRPSYWRFIVKVSDKRFAMVNRNILNAFGTNASLINTLTKTK